MSHLDSIAGVQIHSKFLVSNDKTFFFINAVTEEGLALEKIAKQYNNVTWKQCKLVEKAAWPHLLECLAQEQLQGKNDQGSQLPIQEMAANQMIPCQELVMEEESTIESTGMLDNVAKSDSNETSSFQSSPSLDGASYVWSEDE